MSEATRRGAAETALRKALHQMLAEVGGWEPSEKESAVLLDGVVDLMVEIRTFRLGRRRNGHAQLQVNLRDAEVRGHETASRRVG